MFSIQAEEMEIKREISRLNLTDVTAARELGRDAWLSGGWYDWAPILAVPITSIWTAVNFVAILIIDLIARIAWRSMRAKKELPISDEG